MSIFMKLVLSILIICMTNQCYKILTVKELEAQLKLNSIKELEFDTCLKTNNCFAYYLKSGEVILLPNNSSELSKGILFENKNCFLDCVEKDSFPIENESKTIEEKYSTDINTVNRGINEMVNYLFSKLVPDKNVDFIDASSLSQILQEAKIKRKRLSEREVLYSALALGEYVRRLNNGKWILLKQYGTFNPYYVPAIIYPDNSILPFWNYLNSYFKDTNTTPEVFANLPYIKNPVLKIESEFFKNNYFGYTILE